MLGVTAMGPTLEGARRRAYAAVPAVTWPGVQFRTDIAAGAAGAG